MRTFLFNWTVTGTTSIEAETLDDAETAFDKLTVGEIYEGADQSDFNLDELKPGGPDGDMRVQTRYSDGRAGECCYYSALVTENFRDDEFAAHEAEMAAQLRGGVGASYRLPICAGLFVDVVRI